jgi:hypothetical protein
MAPSQMPSKSISSLKNSSADDFDYSTLNTKMPRAEVNVSLGVKGGECGEGLKPEWSASI